MMLFFEPGSDIFRGLEILTCCFINVLRYLQRHLATTPKTKEDIKLQADLVCKSQDLASSEA